jgi:hypothetical protein
MAPAPFDTEGSAAYQNGGDGAMHSLATRGRRVTELTEGDSDLALETTPLSPRVRSNTEAAADGVRLDFGQRTRSKSIMSMKGASTPRRGGGGGAVGGVSCGCCPPEGSWCRNALAVALLLLFVAATAVTAAVIVILLFPGSSTARNSDSGMPSAHETFSRPFRPVKDVSGPVAESPVYDPRGRLPLPRYERSKAVPNLYLFLFCDHLR